MILMQPSFLIAVPMYNEGSYAEKCIQEINAVLDEIDLTNGIVAINDGSEDDTLEILQRLALRFPRVNIVDHGINQGYGASIKSAYRFGLKNGFDYVLFIDADLTQDPSYIFSFIPYMEKNIEYIKASRYIEGSAVIGVPKFRKIVSVVGNKIAQIAFGLPISDYTNGFRAVKTDLAKQFNLESNHFEILVEEMWQAQYLTNSFAQINYTLTSRTVAEDSKFTYSLKVYWKYLKYCLKAILRIKPDFESTQLSK